MNWKDHIVVVPGILAGKPVINGTRISVEFLLDRVAHSWSVDDILASYPDLSRDDVLAALSFAAEMFREEKFVAVGEASS
jgi:uncharacterized protein (DUF433 family)